MIIDLSKRLQRSLDSNYNVIDLVAVFEIIRILEGTPITTEQLETTRLAKYINQLRRKTTNEQLARQAKNLLKKWRDNLMPAIASGSQPAPAAGGGTAPTAGVVSPAAPLTNGMVRSQPTTPSRPVLQQQNHHSVHHNNNNNNSNHHLHHQQTSSSCDKVIIIPDHDDNDSKSLGSSNLVNNSSRRPVPPPVSQHSVGQLGGGGGGGPGSNSGSTEVIGGGGLGAGLTIPTELTNFYLKNKKIIDGSDVRVVVPMKEEPDHNNPIPHPFAVDEIDPGDVDARDKQKRKGRKKGSKGFDSLIGGSTGSLYNSNSNSGFAGVGDQSTTATGGNTSNAASAVGKKVKTTRQLVADLKFRNEQNLRNASYTDLSNEHNNNHNGIGGSSSPMSASNDSQQHLFHHHNHNQHLGGHHEQMVFHSAPVTPSGTYATVPGLKREAGSSPRIAEDGSATSSSSARKREKKRRKIERERAMAAARLKVKKREKTPPPVSGMNFLNQVDEDIWQLKNKLPPIDRKAILRQIKSETVTQAQRQCTCEMVECSQEEAEKAAGVVYPSLDDIPVPTMAAMQAGGTEVGNPEEPAANNLGGSLENNSVTDHLAPATLRPSTSATTMPTANAVRNKRSIFDDDDVVMDELPSPAALDKNNNSEEEGTNSREERLPFPRPPVDQNRHQQQHPHPPPQLPVVIAAVPPLPNAPAIDDALADDSEMPEEERVFYRFNEHPNCVVRRRKDDLLRLNADYHLAALHQLYVPGVNGNWSCFPDLTILKRTQRQQMHELVKARRQQQRQQQLGRKRKRSSSSSSDDDDDNEEEEDEEKRTRYVYPSSANCASSSSGSSLTIGPDNSELLTCWERLQEKNTTSVEAVVPLVNPLFYFLTAPDERLAEDPSSAPVNLLANMAGRLPRYVPLRSDFSVVVVPPEMPVVAEGEEPPPPPKTAPPIQFNREVAKELNIEDVCEGLKGDVYEPRELEKFLEATLAQRLPKFQMANLFYKRSWPGAEDRQHNLSLELLNSLYLNRVLEFRRRGRRRRRAIEGASGGEGDDGGRIDSITHRKRRRKSSGGAEEEDEGEEEEEEVEVNDVHVFDGFLEMQTMAFRNGGEPSGDEHGGQSLVAVKSARRLFYVNDERLFGYQPSILDEMAESGGDDPLPVLDSWDLFRVQWQALEFLPPVLSATARSLYSSWPRMRWNFLLDYFKDRQQNGVAMLVEATEDGDDGEGGEVIRIHENNFRLPSFNRLTEENLLGVRQRRGRRRFRLPGEEDEDEEWKDEATRSVLPDRIKWQLESYRERDFVRVCLEKWPQLLEGCSFDYEKGQLEMRHMDVDTRWRFMGEFRELLCEVTRLGVAGEEEDDDEEEVDKGMDLKSHRLKNGFSSIKSEPGESGAEDEDEVVVAAGSLLQRADEPQVELFKEWHESVQVQSYNDELLTILPYVIID